MGNFCGAHHLNNHSPPKPPSPTTNKWRNYSSEPNGYLAAGTSVRDIERAENINSNTNKNINDNGINIIQETVAAAPSNRGLKVITPKLKEFSYEELKKATRDFRPDTMLGEGGFGRVFKGWVDETTYAPSKAGVGIAVAVKKSNSDSYQGQQEWQAEVNFLGKYCHPNLVRLLGYCSKDNQFLLVYEYMQKGSLENHLFGKGPEPLPWELRLKIAIGAARGLAYLHTYEKVIYRDFKASNILLDPDYNAKLSDFGLAKQGPVNGNSHVTTRIIGTYGYAAPEYVATGHLYVKSDVYGFGVVLLEILTGLRALDPNRPTGEHSLVDWARPFLNKKKGLKKIMDPSLEDQYSLKGACQAAQLILKCLESDPKTRPSMEEVLEILEKINANKEKERPKDTKANAMRQHQHSSHQHHYSHRRSPIHQTHFRNGVRSQAHPY